MNRAHLAYLLPEKNREALIEKWFTPLASACETFNVNTPKREAAFLAQILHESGYLTRVEENLNYKAARLVDVFPRHVKSLLEANRLATAGAEAIANHVYANRMGNGSPDSGDGYRYRGRGLIQLTGKENYLKAGAALDVDLVAFPDRLTDPKWAAMSAAWFFDRFGCNEIADRCDIKAITIKINGGVNGLEDRTHIYNRALSVMGAT